MEREKGAVCVTGGAGYVASWLIMRLLHEGYSVHATVRTDPEYKEDVSHLLNLPDASEKLKIFDADLANPKSFEPAITGCFGVFHLSHPLDLEGKMPVDTIIKIATEGIQGIIQACLKSKTVKKLVYTSTAAAALSLDSKLDEIDENVWTDVELVKNFGDVMNAYITSKTLSEKAALEFSKEHGLDVVTIIPSAVIGPFISSSLPNFFPISLPLVFGNEESCTTIKAEHWVHIDDIAAANIFLFECPKAEGRYICSKTAVTLHEVAKLLRVKYSQYMIPTEFLSKLDEKKPDCILSSRKLMDLGFEFKYGVEEMIEGALECCKEKGFL